MADEKALQAATVAMERLAKWRMLFTGWQLGTRQKGDPEGDAVRDHRELTIMLRCELTALTGLLVEKGVFTAEELTVAMGREADLLNQDYERRFPGVKASEDGLTFNRDAIPWMSKWKP